MKSTLSDAHFHDEKAAYAYVEARVWPEGPVCPHCGGSERISKMGGKSTRVGTYKCYACRKPFTVKVGTIFSPVMFRCAIGCKRSFFCHPARKASAPISSRALSAAL